MSGQPALTPESTLRELLQTLPQGWQNWGDLNFLDYGGKQFRLLDAEHTDYIEALELVVPSDWDANDYLVQQGTVCLSEIFYCCDGDTDEIDLLDARLSSVRLTRKAIDAADTTHDDINLAEPAVLTATLIARPSTVFSLAYDWTGYYGIQADTCETVHYRHEAFGLDDDPYAEARMSEACRRYLAWLNCADIPSAPKTPRMMPGDVVARMYQSGTEGVVEGVHFTWRGDLRVWHVWSAGSDEVQTAANEHDAALIILSCMAKEAQND